MWRKPDCEGGRLIHCFYALLNSRASAPSSYIVPLLTHMHLQPTPPAGHNTNFDVPENVSLTVTQPVFKFTNFLRRDDTPVTGFGERR